METERTTRRKEIYREKGQRHMVSKREEERKREKEA